MQSDGSLTPEWVEIGGMALPPFIVESLEERLVRSKCLPDNKIWGRAQKLDAHKVSNNESVDSYFLSQHLS